MNCFQITLHSTTGTPINKATKTSWNRSMACCTTRYLRLSLFKTIFDKFLIHQYQIIVKGLNPVRSHFIGWVLYMIVRVNVVPWTGLVVDSGWRFDNLCVSHLQSQSELYHVSRCYRKHHRLQIMFLFFDYVTGKEQKNLLIQEPMRFWLSIVIKLWLLTWLVN